MDNLPTTPVDLKKVKNILDSLPISATTREILAGLDCHIPDPERTAYNIRENSRCAGRHSTAEIQIVPKTDGKSGVDVYVAAGTVDQSVYIPACISQSGVDEDVYNDFHVGAGARVKIIAGCGIHTHSNEKSRHSGIHNFYLEAGARVIYVEKHLGGGVGRHNVQIDPITHCELAEGSYLEMDTVQIGGVDDSRRLTTGTVGAGASLVVKESLLTELEQRTTTDFNITLAGADSSVELASRSVAKDDSYQEYTSIIVGDNACKGHSACDAILVGRGRVDATPSLRANHPDAQLIHEAAIGKIAGDQIIKLQTLGLTEAEAEQKIIDGFLRTL